MMAISIQTMTRTIQMVIRTRHFAPSYKVLLTKTIEKISRCIQMMAMVIQMVSRSEQMKEGTRKLLVRVGQVEEMIKTMQILSN